MTPGDSICLQFVTGKPSDEYQILPCYQISACLQGAEHVISFKGEKKKSRSYIFDTDHERIYPGATNLVSLSLNLPERCPVTISSDFVEIAMECRIDFTVKVENSDSFRFLTVEFPCCVVQSVPDEIDEDNRLSVSTENEILDLKWPVSDHSEERRVISSEVVNDLNMLSLHQSLINNL